MKKTIKDTRKSLKEEIDGLAEGMKREMMGVLERKMKGFLQKFREEQVTRLDTVGEGVVEVKNLMGEMDWKLAKQANSGPSVREFREVLREEVPRAIENSSKDGGSRGRAAGRGERWSEVVGSRKRGPRVVINVKDKGEKEDVRQELIKCLDPKEREVRVRNIRR